MSETETKTSDKTVKLTAKQERFCQEYLIDANATQAAIRAGYSAKTAQEIGAQNLSKLIIQSRLAELQSGRQVRTERTADEVVKKLWEVADYTIEQICDYDGETVKFKPLKDWTPAAKTTVRTVKQTSVTTYDRQGNPNRKDVVEFKGESLSTALQGLVANYGLNSDFNMAVATLARYGIVIKCKDGRYYIDNETTTATAN